MKLPLIVLLLCSLAACQNNSPALVKSLDSRKKSKDIINPTVHYGVEGFYTGPFEASKYKDGHPVMDNKITICIDSLDNTSIYGHSIYAGNYRLFEGSYKKNGQDYAVTVKELGEHKTDGTFEFNIDNFQQKIYGTWKANDSSLSITVRNFKLEKRPYRYYVDYSLPDEIVGEPFYNSIDDKTLKGEAITDAVLKTKNPSALLLAKEDVENMYQGDLEVLRNSIYARHGYSFKNPRMRALFDYVEWYMPVATDVTSKLTPIEKKNITLIKAYEKHAEKYYDNFGR